MGPPRVRRRAGGRVLPHRRPDAGGARHPRLTRPPATTVGVVQQYTVDNLGERPLPAWFDDAKFGIFVHWYPSSVPAFAPLNPDPFTLARE
ncbi:MAG: alpha-L-fucosidase, partial [Ilumatobacter sp.]|nr:alpha-L-fucosidase [Ilumatobacter sp.]